MSLTKSISTQERTDIWDSSLLKAQADQAYNALYSKNTSHFINRDSKRHPDSLKRIIPINARSINIKSRESMKNLTDKFSTNSFSSNILTHPDITTPSGVQHSVGETEGLLVYNGSSSSRKPYLAFNQSNSEKNTNTTEKESQQNIINKTLVEKTLSGLSGRESRVYERGEGWDGKIPTSRNNFVNGSLAHSDNHVEECNEGNLYSRNIDQIPKNQVFYIDVSHESQKNLHRDVSELEANAKGDKTIEQFTQQPFLADNEQTFRADTIENNVLITEHNELRNQTAVPINNLEGTTNLDEPTPDLERFYEPETLIYMCKVIAYCIGTIMCSGSILLVILNRFVYVPFFMVVMAYIAFLFITDAFWKTKVLGELYIKTEDVYQIGDTGAGFISLFIVFFKIVRLFSVCSFAFGPSVVVIIAYLTLSKASRGTKAGKILMRLLILVQILLISLALDDSIKSEWLLILTPTLFILGFLLISHFVSIYSVFRRLLKNKIIGNANKIFGFLWYLTYLSTVAFGFMAVIGFVKAYSSENDFYFLEMTCYVALIGGTFLLLYTLIAWKWIKQLIISMKLIRSYLAEYEASKPRPRVRKVNLEVEKKENYFVMLSPTYFKKLHSIFESRSLKNLQKSKSTSCCIQLQKSISKEELPPKQYNEARSIKTDMLKQFSSSNLIPNQRNDNITLRMNQSLNMIRLGSRKLWSTDSFLDINNSAYSADDVKIFQQENDEFVLSKFHMEENICRLCCTNVANTILLHCGHSGLCYECAIVLIDKQAECLECRRKIEAMYKIDPIPKLMNIMKGTELIKITEIFQ